MADTVNVSQVQQGVKEEWKKLVDAQLAQFESLLAEIAKVESKALTQLVGSYEEAGRYAREAVAVAGRATAEWRRLALEATRRAAEVVTP